MTRITLFNVVAALVSATALQAQPAPATTCDNATLKGAYGVNISGTRPNPLNPYGLEQVIGVVLSVFDGAGNLTQTDNVKGSVSGIHFDRPGTGTYSVNPDCTGTFTILTSGAPPLVNRFVILDGGKEFRAVVVSPQAVMVAVHAQRVN